MLVGIDVGTTAVKAALLDETGASLRQHVAPYGTNRPQPGHVEQNPADWMTHVLAALAAFDGADIAGVGLCSQVNTHVFVDAQGQALLPAMTWQDVRCAAVAAELDAKVSVEDKITWWGAPLPIDASHVLARMLYVQRHHPEVWKNTRWVMAPKDYCICHLTGEVTADPMTCFGLVDQDLHGIAPLIALVDGAEERVPPIRGFTTSAGRIRAGLPCAGAPMVVGAMDAWSGLFGAGVSAEGQGLYLSGTSEILGIVSSSKVPTPGVIAFAKCEGLVLHAGPTQSGGASVQWLGRLLGRTPAEISALARAADQRHVPLFLPHLEGERAPLWDATSRGAFSGMTSSTGPAEMARAVLEGVAYSARLAFEALEQSAALRPAVIHHSGGGAASDVWAQIRADVLARPLQRTAMRDAGVLGAALMAGVGSVIYSSIAEAAQRFVQFDHRFEPVAAEASRHEARFARYKLLYEQLKPIHAVQNANGA